MEIREINYLSTVSKAMIPKLNFFVRKFLDRYSDELDELEAGKTFETKTEFEGDFEVYFVDFLFSKKGGGFMGNSDNRLSITCNDEFCGAVYLED